MEHITTNGIVKPRYRLRNKTTGESVAVNGQNNAKFLDFLDHMYRLQEERKRNEKKR